MGYDRRYFDDFFICKTQESLNSLGYWLLDALMETIGRLPVGALMTDVLTVPPNASVSKTIGMLRDSGLYEVFILLPSRVGMITTRDILRVSKIEETKNSTIMNYVPTLSINSTLGDAARIMTEYRIRSLPVVEGKELAGAVTSISAIRSMQKKALPKIKARNLMTAEPIVLEHDDSVSKARSVMIRRRIDHLPILKDKKLSGIITSSLIVFNMLPAVTVERGALGAEKQVRLDYDVNRLMEPNVVTSDVNEDLGQVVGKIVGLGSTYSVVTMWDEVQGIITHRDLVKLLAEQEAEAGVPAYIIGLPQDPFEAESAKDKFRRVVKLLKKGYPEIQEARSVIKVKERGERRRYEVKVVLSTPYRNYSYTEIGWDLPVIYDNMSNRIKRLLAERPSRRHRESVERHIKYQT